MRATIKNIALTAMMTLTLCSSGCSGGSGSRSDMAENDAYMLETIVAAEVSQKPTTAANNETADEAATERKLTKTGVIRFESANPAKTTQLIRHAVSELKGYISSENASTSSGHRGRTENTIVIRIPASQFDALLQKIELSAAKVDYKNVDVQDVTQEYIDLDARLKTKKEVEARYQELLKRATTVDEILKIEEQIGSIRSDIESAEGRLRYLSKQVSYSTLSVTFYEHSQEFGFWAKIKKSFRNGWNGLLWLLIGITNLWAIILFGIVISIVIAYLIRRGRKGKKTQQ